MTLQLLSPEWNRTIEADAVFVPGVLGEFEMLPGHAAIVSSLTSGNVKWRAGGVEESLKISGGVVRCIGDKIQICVAL